MAVLNFRAPSILQPEFLKIVNASTARKKAAEERLQLYNDKQADDLIALLDSAWGNKRTMKPGESGSSSFRTVFINIVKKIVDKRATVYKRAPKRTFEGWDQTKGEELYRQLGANVVFKKANAMTALFKTSALQIVWNEKRGQARLCIVTPNVLDVEHDGFPEDPSRVIVTHPNAKQELVTYSDWTADGYSLKDWRGYPKAVEGNSGNVNPYGVLPFVPLFDRIPESEFFLDGGDDIIVAQRALNVALANIWRATEWQALGQPVITGVTDQDVFSGKYNVTEVGPNRNITLPVGGTFDFKSPQPNVEAMLLALEFLIKQTAVANNLAANVFELDSKAESGAAKIAESRDLIEARADDVELWRRYEAQAFETIKAVVNVHAPDTIPEAATVSVDFGEIDEALSDNDRLTNYRERIDLGLWSPVDALMADNPDIRARDDALKILQERREESAALGAAFSGPAFGGV